METHIRTITLFTDIHDSKGNSFQITKVNDDSQNFEPKGHCHTTRDDNQSDEDYTMGPYGHELDEMLDALFEQETLEMKNDKCQLSSLKLPRVITYDTVQMKGDHECGYNNLCPVNVGKSTKQIVQREEESSKQKNCDVNASLPNGEAYCPTKQDLVSVILSHKAIRKRMFQTQFHEKQKKLNILEANRSAKSIQNWSRLANLDQEQVCAFCIF